MNPRRMLPIALIAALAAVLIWWLWVLPINESVRAAEPHPLGTPTTVSLQDQQHVGIWSDSVASSLGTLSCTILDAQKHEIATGGAPALNWDDALWWVTARPGFSQVRSFTAPQAGEYTVGCTDSTGWYDGDFLVAQNSFGDGSIGLGRTGSNDFALGTILVFGAVVTPLLAILLGIMSLIALATRARSRR